MLVVNRNYWCFFFFTDKKNSDLENYLRLFCFYSVFFQTLSGCFVSFVTFCNLIEVILHPCCHFVPPQPFGDFFPGKMNFQAAAKLQRLVGDEEKLCELSSLIRPWLCASECVDQQNHYSVFFIFAYCSYMKSYRFHVYQAFSIGCCSFSHMKNFI